MAAHPGPLSEAGAESSLQEVNWQLRSQLEKTSQDFLDLKEKFLVSEATAYSLANQLRKYKCEKSSDLIKSVLGEKVLCEKGKRADTLPEKLRTFSVFSQLRLCHLLIQDQAKELTRLYKKLREGEDVSQLLVQHLEALLIHDGAEHSQGQGLRGQLAEGRRLAKCLAQKLSPENYDHEGDDDDNDDEEEEVNVQFSPPCRLTTQLLEQDTSRDTPDERYLTYSVLPDMSDSYWPYRSSAIFSPENPQVCSSLQVASEYSIVKQEDKISFFPEYQLNHEEEEGQDPLCPRKRIPRKHITSRHITVGFADLIRQSGLCLNDLKQSHLEYLMGHGSCKFLESPNDLFEEEDQDPLGPKPSLCLPEVEEHGPPWDSLDQCYLTHSAFRDLADLHGTSTRADRNSFDDMDSSSALEVAKNHNDLLEVEDQDPICPSSRLCTELPVVEENDVPQDSLDECHLTSSIGHHLPDTWRPCTSASSTRDKEETFEGLDVDAPMQSPCHQGPSSGNLTFPRAQVQSSGAQTQPSTPVADSLQLQLDQHLDRGDNRARLSLSSAIGSLGTNMGCGDQPPL
uniref:Olduvai domain-containing protein n=1 Tax=Mustela putorius furo TaxID=9669 RepID=M3XUC9_MUSPF